MGQMRSLRRHKDSGHERGQLQFRADALDQVRSGVLIESLASGVGPETVWPQGSLAIGIRAGCRVEGEKPAEPDRLVCNPQRGIGRREAR